MKCCLRCDLVKVELDFHRSSKTEDGFSRWCKGCWAVYQKSKRGKDRFCPHCKKSFSPKSGQLYCCAHCALWSKILVSSSTDCWLWQGQLNDSGYGMVSFGGKQQRATRLLMQEIGLDPTGMQVCHTCDTPACCNPKHLFLGTSKDNVLDMHSKGRAKPPKGSDSGMAKIDEELAIAIKSLLPSMYNKDIAAKFGIKKSLVDDISAGRTWRDVSIST